MITFKTNKYFAGVFILIALFASCTTDRSAENEPPDSVENELIVQLNEAQFNSSEIAIGKPVKINLGESLSVNGKLDVPPQSHVSISAPLGGFVKYTEVLEGMKINKGQVLVTLEHPDYIQLQQDYLESTNQLKFLEDEYNRQVELAKENINASKTLQRSHAEFQTAKVKTEGLRLKLDLVNITPEEIAHGKITDLVKVVAPISGYITRVNINTGKYVGPTDVMMTLVNTNHLHAEAMVYEKDIIKVKNGQAMDFTLVNQIEKHKATVFLVGKEVDDHRMVRVHCHLENETVDLLPGMYFTGHISLGETMRYAVPESSVIQFENNSYAFRVVDESKKVYEMIPVKVGINKNGFLEIHFSELIDENSILVTKGAYDLLSLLKNTEEED